jgi:hypothetical protein
MVIRHIESRATLTAFRKRCIAGFEHNRNAAFVAPSSLPGGTAEQVSRALLVVHLSASSDHERRRILQRLGLN